MALQHECGADAGAYVLDALSDEEAEAFRRHLETCSACREEVQSLKSAVAVLPLIVPREEPPPQLRRRVMAEIRAEAKQRARERRAEAGEPEQKHVKRTGPTLPRWGFLARPVARPAMAGIGALLVAVIVTIAVSSGAAGPRLYRAQTAWRAAEATVRVENGTGELLVKGMPAPPAGKVYEVWLQKGHGQPRATKALFDVTSRGGEATVAVPGNLSGVSAVMVTAEPDGGSSHPTSQPVIVARLA